MTPRRQLLERAAKAAGYAITWKTGHCKGGAFEGAFLDGQPWRPLDDDGDALRLAVRLRISPMLAETPPCRPECAFAKSASAGPEWRYSSAIDPDPYAATRLAIVRAAAALADER